MDPLYRPIELKIFFGVTQNEPKLVPSCNRERLWVYATQRRWDRLGRVLGHHEACRKALEHSRMTEPLRRAATVSLCRSQCRRGGLDRDSGITELLRQATSGHKVTGAARRSDSAILGCSITFPNVPWWPRAGPKRSLRHFRRVHLELILGHSEKYFQLHGLILRVYAPRNSSIIRFLSVSESVVIFSIFLKINRAKIQENIFKK